MADERTCPECGRPVPPGQVKLCPGCGYPLLLEGTPNPVGPTPEILRKPGTPQHVQPDTGMFSHTAPPVVRPLGPRCPSCHHTNRAQRVRCEICGTELWPGSAMPVVAQAIVPPASPVVQARRPWGRIVALVLVPALVVLLAYGLAYLLQ